MVLMRVVPVAFYSTEHGKEPVRIWLKNLDSADRVSIGKDIAAAEYGWPVGMPLCRALGQGLFEIRSGLTSGRTARVIFCIAGGRMVLLHGFIKKTQKTPKNDLDLAMKRKKELRS